MEQNLHSLTRTTFISAATEIIAFAIVFLLLSIFNSQYSPTLGGGPSDAQIYTNLTFTFIIIGLIIATIIGNIILLTKLLSFYQTAKSSLRFKLAIILTCWPFLVLLLAVILSVLNLTIS